MVSLTVGRNRTAERAAMTVYRAALRKALQRIDLGAETLLERADARATLAPMEAQIAWADVILFERLHPDVAMWSPDLVGSVNPGADVALATDAIFRLAMALERQESGAAELAAARAVLGL